MNILLLIYVSCKNIFATTKEEKCLSSAKKGEKKKLCYLPFIFTRKLRNFCFLSLRDTVMAQKKKLRKNIASNKTCYKSTLILLYITGGSFVWGIKEMTDNAHVTHQYITRPPKSIQYTLYLSHSRILHLHRASVFSLTSFIAIQKAIRRVKTFYLGLEFCLLLKYSFLSQIYIRMHRVADSVEHLRRKKGNEKHSSFMTFTL